MVKEATEKRSHSSEEEPTLAVLREARPRETPQDHAHPFLVAFFTVLIGLILLMQLGWLSPLQNPAQHYSQSQSISPAKSQSRSSHQTARMSLSPFDVQKAKEFMDKNNDGMCDSCGMPVDMCIQGGQIQCTMGAHEGGIGELGTQHIHADWKVYINGKPFNWSGFASLHERQMQGDKSISLTSSFMHLHPEKDKESGGVLHMHAASVPLWLFFQSMGMNLSDDCLTISGVTISEKGLYCDDAKSAIKFFVNGKKTEHPADFVFHDKDQLLLSFGPKDEDVQSQLESISRNAQKESEEAEQEGDHGA